MSVQNFTIQPMGEKAILINFEPEISEKMLEKVLIAKNFLENCFIKEKIEVINTFHSLLINYSYTIEDVYKEILTIKRVLNETKIGINLHNLLFHIPVCYDPVFGWDLELLAEEKKLSVNEIIELHVEPIYTVYFIGFLPGFLYLGGLKNELHFPRKNEPRIEVPKGAVGIGENQTGIYPNSSPGGWQIIGSSPVNIFDKKGNPPCAISAGDKVKFYAVDKERYEEIREAVSGGIFQLKKEKYEG
ncbi:MAG TPA: 5-oxoprolinase subunit PxpB [Gillisia sp.]|nr:5-oxoprolinase subunit PxpB [Gillisia sp.]